MTYQRHVPMRPKIAHRFMPATGNLALGLLEAAWDDIISILILCSEALEGFSSQIWHEAKEASATMLHQWRKKPAHSALK